jgi:hypothetical protein
VLFLLGDGVRTLADILDEWTPDLVVPAAPGHLAALAALERGHRRYRELVPAPNLLAPVSERLPPRAVCLTDERNAVLVTSFMGDGLCVEDCPQPTACPVTGRANAVPMHELLDAALELAVDRHAVLSTAGPGSVGGLRGSDLVAMLAMVDEAGAGDTIGIATSCRCHGVVNLLCITGQ